jgi:sortase B
MFDGSMFSDIILYTNQDYFDAHRVLFLCTPTRNYELSAVAAVNVAADAPLRQFSFENKAAFTTFVESILAEPVAAAGDLSAIVAGTESLYSLVTCELIDASRRVVLCCVEVRSVEPSVV